MAYLLLYVDDIILTTSSHALRLSIMSSLGYEFAMKDFGPLNYFLGIGVSRTKDGLFLSRSSMLITLLSVQVQTHLHPVDTKPKLSATMGKPFANSTLYGSLAGALQYLTFTRPDIAYAVQHVCMFMHDPREPHFNALIKSHYSVYQRYS